MKSLRWRVAGMIPESSRKRNDRRRKKKRSGALLLDAGQKEHVSNVFRIVT